VRKVILLGAGASVPFGIPDMKGFVDGFEKYLSSIDEQNLCDFLEEIENALQNSQRLIGTKIEFDLESLMIVLQDLTSKDRPISIPTLAFMIYLMSKKDKKIGTYNIANVRKAYRRRPPRLLRNLRRYVFEMCMKPINEGQLAKYGFSFLDKFYGPLFLSMGKGDANANTIQWIFTTNWDLCLKQWLEYARLGFEDGTILDRQRKAVLAPSLGWSSTNVQVVPLHGSLDLIRKTRHLAKKPYEDIQKVTAPETYFKGNPSELSHAFIIYPLEAVGYEQSVRSPYLDMLNLLKQALKTEREVFVIGFSFRDSTIASIFDEAVRARVQQDEEKYLKFFLINRSPETVIENLLRQGYANIGRTLIPVKISFPDIEGGTSTEIRSAMSKVTDSLLKEMETAGILIDKMGVAKILVERYGLSFPSIQ